MQPAEREKGIVAANRSTEGQVSPRLGVSPLSWLNEVLEDFGLGTTAETCLSEAASAGYAGVEMSRIFPRDAARLSELLARHDVQLISGWYSGFLADRDVFAELEAARPHAALLQQCGASVMVYDECGAMAENALDVPMSDHLRMPRNATAAYGERLTRFSEALRREHGLALSYHHHLMMISERLEEIEAIMAPTGPAVARARRFVADQILEPARRAVATGEG